MADGNKDRPAGCKMLTLSAFGATARSSKTYVKTVTYSASVIYSDTDSVEETEHGCKDKVHLIKQFVVKDRKATIFAEVGMDVGADVKGDYRSTIISAKRKRNGVKWGDTSTGFRSRWQSSMKGNMTNNDEMYETSMVQQLPSGPCLDTQISKNLEFLVVARSYNGDGTVSLVVCKREYKYMLANEVLQTVKKCESASAK
ncbi:hypothetical protein CaCOL14_013187 [Colletotrichum acutatum]